MARTALVGMGLVSLGMVLSPGPNMVHLVTRAVADGRRAGFVALAGVTAAFGVHLAATVAGIAAVFAVVPALYTALKLLGATYLLWLAWRTLCAPAIGVGAPTSMRATGGPGRWFVGGFVTNLLNPKIAVLYLSLLPQFVVASAGGVGRQSLALGAVQIVVAVSVNALLVLGAGSVRRFLVARPTWQRVQRAVAATLLAGLAVRIAVDRSRAVAA